MDSTRLEPQVIPPTALLQSPGMVVRDVALRTFRFAPSLPRRFACGPRPLTAAGGQGPQDNTAYDPATSIHSSAAALKAMATAPGGLL